MNTCIIKGVIKEEANKQHSKPPYIKQTIFSHVTKQLTFEEQANQRCTHVYTSSSEAGKSTLYSRVHFI